MDIEFIYVLFNIIAKYFMSLMNIEFMIHNIYFIATFKVFIEICKIMYILIFAHITINITPKWLMKNIK